jgi:hypothetical protein
LARKKKTISYDEIYPLDRWSLLKIIFYLVLKHRIKQTFYFIMMCLSTEQFVIVFLFMNKNSIFFLRNQRCSSQLKTCRCRDAMVYKKKCFELGCCDRITLEILVLVHQSQTLPECFTCKHWNSIKFVHLFNVFKKKNAAAAAMNF